MALSQHTKKGNQAYGPKGGIKTGPQIKHGMNTEQELWGDWEFLGGGLTLYPLNASKEGL